MLDQLSTETVTYLSQTLHRSTSLWRQIRRQGREGGGGGIPLDTILQQQVLLAKCMRSGNGKRGSKGVQKLVKLTVGGAAEGQIETEHRSCHKLGQLILQQHSLGGTQCELGQPGLLLGLCLGLSALGMVLA